MGWGGLVGLALMCLPNPVAASPPTGTAPVSAYIQVTPLSSSADPSRSRLPIPRSASLALERSPSHFDWLPGPCPRT